MVLLKRIYDRKGKSRYYINGELVLARQMKKIGGLLFDLHGQHDSQSIIHPDTQLRILDAFGKLAKKKSAFSEGYRRFKSFLEKRKRLREEREKKKVPQDL